MVFRSTQQFTRLFLAALAVSGGMATMASATPLPVAQVPAEPGPDAPPVDLQKQIDDALKQLDKIVPNQPDEVKKQIEDVRKEMRQQLLQGLDPEIFGGGFFPQPGFGGFGRIGMAPGRMRLGVILNRPTSALTEQLRLPQGQGLVLADVMPDSPAAKAGLRRHDILLELDGKPVPSHIVRFQNELRDIKSDVEIEAVIVRKGQKETIKGLKLPELKAEAEAPAFPGFPPGAIPNIQIVPGVPGFVPGGFGGIGGPIQLQVIGNAGNGESTAVSVSNDDFTIKHASGGLKIGIKGKRENGKANPSEITIDEGETSVRAQTMDQVPERFRPTVNRLLDGVK